MTDTEPRAQLVATRFRDRLGGLMVGGFLMALGVLFWKGIPEPNEQLITYMIGQLSGFAGSIVAFHYTMNALNVQATGNTGKLADAMTEQAKAVQAGASTTGTADNPMIVEGAEDGAAVTTKLERKG